MPGEAPRWHPSCGMARFFGSETALCTLLVISASLIVSIIMLPIFGDKAISISRVCDCAYLARIALPRRFFM